MRYADIGYRGDGEIPALPDSVWAQTGSLYQEAYELLTGKTFAPAAYPAGERIVENLRKRGIDL